MSDDDKMTTTTWMDLLDLCRSAYTLLGLQQLYPGYPQRSVLPLDEPDATALRSVASAAREATRTPLLFRAGRVLSDQDARRAHPNGHAKGFSRHDARFVARGQHPT